MFGLLLIARNDGALWAKDGLNLTLREEKGEILYLQCVDLTHTWWWPGVISVTTLVSCWSYSDHWPGNGSGHTVTFDTHQSHMKTWIWHGESWLRCSTVAIPVISNDTSTTCLQQFSPFQTWSSSSESLSASSSSLFVCQFLPQIQLFTPNDAQPSLHCYTRLRHCCMFIIISLLSLDNQG